MFAMEYGIPYMLILFLHMKRIWLLLFPLLLCAVRAEAVEYNVKLRSSHNPGNTRIVLEGPESVIARAIVNQAGQDVLVTFIGRDVTVQADEGSIPFVKTAAGRFVISPGKFKGMKVLTLKDPSRLVIDVVKEPMADDVKETPVPPFSKEVAPAGPPAGQEGKGIFPEQKEGTRPAKITVVLDAGHGGFESGIVKDDQSEKNVVLDITRKFAALSRKGSFRCLLSRPGDMYMSLNERIKAAKSMNTDVFVSVHIGNHEEVVIYMPVEQEPVQEPARTYLFNRGQAPYIKSTVLLLNALKDAASEEFGRDMVMVRPLPHSILSEIEAAALMIELPSFRDAQYTDEFRMEMANMLMRGIAVYEESEKR